MRRHRVVGRGRCGSRGGDVGRGLETGLGLRAPGCVCRGGLDCLGRVVASRAVCETGGRCGDGRVSQDRVVPCAARGVWEEGADGCGRWQRACAGGTEASVGGAHSCVRLGPVGPVLTVWDGCGTAVGLHWVIVRASERVCSCCAGVSFAGWRVLSGCAGCPPR